MKNKIFPQTFWRPPLDFMLQLFFKPKYVWFPVHLKGPDIPDPSGQLAELIVYITSTKVDLYSHQILLLVKLIYSSDLGWGNRTTAHSWRVWVITILMCFVSTLVFYQLTLSFLIMFITNERKKTCRSHKIITKYEYVIFILYDNQELFAMWVWTSKHTIYVYIKGHGDFLKLRLKCGIANISGLMQCTHGF